ncbi:MAG: glycoside hydrolase family 25 protein [Oscillospiraceae bacterium]
MKQQKKGRGAIVMLTAICVLLSTALIVTLVSFVRYKNSVILPVNTQINEELAEELPKEEVVAMETLKEYAAQYNVGADFLQRFFDDVIVYKDAEGIVYSPIDKNLPKNSYDFTNLVRVDGEMQYQEDGVSKGIKGIDVSKHQGDIKWEKVKADNVEYAMIRLGYRGYETGKLLLDEYYEKNIKGALDAGLKVGVYFFSQAVTVEEAIEEADMVLEYIKKYDITYPVVYDAEEMLGDDVRTNSLTSSQRTDITLAFCEKIKSAGYKPMIYANIKWFVAKLDMSRLTEYDKWFAQYFNTPFFPYDLQMWQYTGKGKVDGIKGDVDLNIGFKDYSLGS